MQVKDQLKIRMEQLGVDVRELADRLHVSNQTVRHWINGRSFPGKRKAPLLEKALSFKLDYSEGMVASNSTIEQTLKEADVKMFRAYQRMPEEVRLLFSRLAEAYSDGDIDDDVEEPREITVDDIKPFEPKPKLLDAGRRPSTPRR